MLPDEACAHVLNRTDSALRRGPPDRPRNRRPQPRKSGEKRRLPATGLADDADRLTGHELNRDTRDGVNQVGVQNRAGTGPKGDVDVIKEDDVLFEVNTAKVSAEIPSPVEGKIVEILFQEGDTVAVGTVVAVVDMGGDDEVSESPAGTAESAKVAAADNVASDASAAARELPEAQAAKSEDERWYSPVVLQLAREDLILQEELENLAGTG